MRIALSIAGSDPTGGAGLQLDVQVFRSLGVHGAGVPTALTVQDTGRVEQVLPVFPSVVLDQLRTLLRDMTPHAIKLGMLASDDVLRSVGLALEGLEPGTPLVIDPVLRSSSGSFLLERRAWGGLKTLCADATLVTPNLPEAEALSERDVSSRSGVESAGRFFVEELAAEAALVKGGHREGPADDCLVRREPGGHIGVQWLEGERIAGGPVHGTGCALSSAIAARLALGDDLEKAIAAGRSFVRDGLRRAAVVGSGAPVLGFP